MLEPKPSYSNERQNNKGMCFSFFRKRSTNETINQEMNDLPPVVEVTEDNFHQIVIDSEKDVLIEFYITIRITNRSLLNYSLHVLKSQRYMRRWESIIIWILELSSLNAISTSVIFPLKSITFQRSSRIQLTRRTHLLNISTNSSILINMLCSSKKKGVGERGFREQILLLKERRINI